MTFLRGFYYNSFVGCAGEVCQICSLRSQLDSAGRVLECLGYGDFSSTNFLGVLAGAKRDVLHEELGRTKRTYKLQGGTKKPVINGVKYCNSYISRVISPSETHLCSTICYKLTQPMAKL